MNSSPLIQFEGISKSFGTVKANDNISFSVSANTFHAIVGENGAGKSTTMKLLFGLIRPDSGKIHFKGKPVEFRSPSDAIKRMIGMVHQHFKLVPTLPVWENIILGLEPSKFDLNAPSILPTLDSLQKDFGFNLDLMAAVETLPVGQQQQVEILKLLYRKAEILILDEPTAVLTPQEVTTLFQKLKALQHRGKTILVVTHKLKEVLTFSERVTVMKSGRSIRTVDTKELTEQSLSQLIMGRQKTELPRRNRTPHPGSNVLQIDSLSTRSFTSKPLSNFSLSLRPGQILGLAGIEGQGQEELVDVICQLRPFSGTVSLFGQFLQTSPAYSKRQNGFALIPPDRQREGLVLGFSNADNFLLGHQHEPVFQQRGHLNPSKIRSVAQGLMDRFDVRPPNPNLFSRHLSGGNQQKMIIARETHSSVRFLLACHPTRGIDIGSIEFIHSHFLKLADEGAGILLISSDLDELFALSDSIAVIREGTIVFQGTTPDLSLTELGLWMTGAKA